MFDVLTSTYGRLDRALPPLVRAMGGNASSCCYLIGPIITFPSPDRIAGMMRGQGFEVIGTGC